MKKKVITLRSAKIKITKLKNLLWECYGHLQELYGIDGDDILTGDFAFLFRDGETIRKDGEVLKTKLRKVL